MLVAQRLSIPRLKSLEQFMVKVRRHDAEPCDGRYVHNASGPAGDHSPPHRLAKQKSAGQVDVQYGLPLFEWHLFGQERPRVMPALLISMSIRPYTSVARFAAASTEA